MHEYRNKRAPIDHMIDLENMREMEEALLNEFNGKKEPTQLGLSGK